GSGAAVREEESAAGEEGPAPEGGHAQQALKLVSSASPDPRLGLGARVAPNAKRAAPTDPVERRLLGKVNAQKRKSAEEEKTNTQEVN
uniref:Uncharacterized protein n=1 Tax=Aegilops tauschii subsp. strangulata TaxID=200361 RepID=A0A453GDM6_AEGTS